MVIAAALPLVSTVLPSLGVGVATTAVGAGVITGLTQAVGGIVLGQAITPKAFRSPKIKPGEFLKAALEIQALSEAGQVPRITTDPFTGNFVISTEDQSGILNQLLAERSVRELLAPGPEDIEEARQIRTTALALVPGQGSPTARVLAPGIVARGPRIKSTVAAASRTLSGPCAGGGTGFSRIRCNVGGFA